MACALERWFPLFVRAARTAAVLRKAGVPLAASRRLILPQKNILDFLLKLKLRIFVIKREREKKKEAGV